DKMIKLRQESIIEEEQKYDIYNEVLGRRFKRRDMSIMPFGDLVENLENKIWKMQARLLNYFNKTYRFKC
ncbi:hypothetical protein MKW92_041252, partial [Papaver armeniacum]